MAKAGLSQLLTGEGKAEAVCRLGLAFCEQESRGQGADAEPGSTLPAAPGTAWWKLGNPARERGGVTLGLALVSSGLGC